MKPYQKFKSFARHELAKHFDRMVIDRTDTEWAMFARFRLTKQADAVTVYDQATHKTVTFGSTRSAAAWCTSERHGRHALSVQIYSLDKELTRITESIVVEQGVMRRAQCLDNRQTMIGKIQHKQVRATQLMSSLNKSINQAKYIQLQGFDNETSRV